MYTFFVNYLYVFPIFKRVWCNGVVERVTGGVFNTVGLVSEGVRVM